VFPGAATKAWRILYRSFSSAGWFCHEGIYITGSTNYLMLVICIKILEDVKQPTSSQLARLDKTFLIFWLSLIRLNAATTSANYFGPSCSKKPQSSFSNIISVTA